MEPHFESCVVQGTDIICRVETRNESEINYFSDLAKGLSPSKSSFPSYYVTLIGEHITEFPATKKIESDGTYCYVIDEGEFYADDRFDDKQMILIPSTHKQV